MHTNPEISEELKEISPYLADLSLPVPYTVPEGYFDALSAQIIQQIKPETSLPVMQPVGYQVPEGYFNSVSDNILSKIRMQEQAGAVTEVQSELQEIAPMLNSISKENVYAVPQGYFGNIAPVEFVKHKHGQPAKVIGLKPTRRWAQYAAAAVLAGVLITGAFIFTGNKQTSSDEYNRMDVAAEIQKLSESDLDTYLYSANNDNSLAPDVKNVINSMSDEELSQYLSENPDADLIIPASN